MSQITRNEYLQKMSRRYRNRGKTGRNKLLTEFCAVTGHERKYASKLLRGRRGPISGKAPGKRGVGKTYGEEVVRVLYEIWRVSEQPCGKRLKTTIPLWLPAFETRHGELDPMLREQVLRISPAQIDRVLAPRKVTEARRSRRTPKAHSAIKSIVPIRAESWDVHQPGWIEGDTVAHCGGHMAESFLWSLTATDIYSGWTEVRATWNRGQHGVCQAFEAMEKELPFSLLGVDTDNGGEFLNYHLYTYFTERDSPVEMTRSRPYRKNDQAHVEQKNDTHVRHLPGYDRLGYHTLLAPVNELLEAWSLWKNLYSTTFKQSKTWREGSKTKRRHEKNPQTPCDRLIDYYAKLGYKAQAERLKESRQFNDPFEIKAWIEAKLAQIWKLRNALRDAETMGYSEFELEVLGRETLATCAMAPAPIHHPGNQMLTQQTSAA